MIDVFHKRLRKNAQKLLDNKGFIGCPAPYLNKEGEDWVISCLHVCGTIFPRWEDITYFKDSGVKFATYNCPCNSPLILITDEEWMRVKDVFWAYVDEVLTTDKSNPPPGVF